MSDLLICETCGTHVRAHATVCPHCANSGFARSAKGAAVAAMLLGLTACGAGDSDSEVQAMYGIALMDNDGDGYTNDVDCDDTNAAIHPDATETAGDGVDSNCDGHDDT